MKPTLRTYQTEDDYWRIREFLREVFLLNDRHEYSWSLLRWDYWIWHVNMNIAVVVREGDGWKFAQMNFSFPTIYFPDVRLME